MTMNKRTDLAFRLLSAFMLLPLAASVAVQYNDPDGLVWMLIYGYSILVTVPAVFGLYSGWAIPGMLGYLGGFIYLVPSFEAPYLKSEMTREGGGLFIAMVWTACVALAWYLQVRPEMAEPEPLPKGTLHLVPPESGTGGGCGSGHCGCGK
jgi:hypothetical protein